MSGKAATKVLVFDLNETFYTKSSKEEFFMFIYKKEPQRLPYFLQMWWFKLLKNSKLMRQTEFKENFFNYLDYLPPGKVAEYAREFWQHEYPDNFNKTLLKRLQRAKTEATELFCATGALEIYVKPLFEIFPVDGFAGTRTRYQDNTYKVIGEACKGEEKLRRINQFYKGTNFRIIEAYSDRYEEMFEVTEMACLVKNGIISPYKSSKR